MNWSEIGRQLKLMEAIVDEAQHSGQMSDLERDLLLETLRKCYVAVRYSEIEVSQSVQPEVVAAAAAMAEVAEEKVAEVEEEVTPEVEEEIAPEEPVVVEEEIAEEESVEEEAEVAPAEEEKPAVEEVVTTVRHKLDRQTIRSLYDDDAPASVATFEPVAEVVEPEVVVAPAEEESAPVFEITEDDADEDGEVVYMADDEEEEEIAEEETAPSIFEITDEEEYDGEAEEEIEELPFSFREVEEESSEEVAPTIADAAQPVTVLGDVVGAERTTIADSITPKEDVASVIGNSQLSSLRSAIGLNDKFLLIRDLFGGDNGAYEAAIDGLDSCQSLDDAMLYIFDNFAWDGECDGAKLMTELLSRRFQ
ncbi:MAG: hypothetical protein IIU82_00195 [Tidjanibacter sp.]|nr:hypothetical protein [Tidjanibacter sp.]